MNYKQLGITQDEYKTYTEVLKKPPTSIKRLSQLTGIKRSTQYSVLESLVDKGLIYEADENKDYRYTAADPQKLVDFAQKSKSEIVSKFDDLKKQLPMLNLFYEGDLTTEETEFYIYKNRENFAQMHEIVGRSNSQMWGLSNHHWFEICFDTDDSGKVKKSDYLDTIMRVGDRFAFTGNRDQFKQAQNHLKNNPELEGHWEPRWIDENKLSVNININTYDDKVLITPIPESEAQEKITIYIKNSKIAQSLQNISKFLWDNAEVISGEN